MKISQIKQKLLNLKLFKIDMDHQNADQEIEALINAGAEIDTLDNKGKTLLMHISHSGNSSALQMLLDKGADVCKVDRYKQSAFYYAALNGHVGVLNILLRDRPIDKLFETNKAGQIALHIAATQGHQHVVAALLNFSPLEQVLKLDNFGLSALHMAAWSGHHAVFNIIIETLLTEGHLHRQARAVIDYAAERGCAHVIEVFLSNLPLEVHLTFFQETLIVCKDFKQHHCIALIEQALLLHTLKKDPTINHQSKEINIKVKKDKYRL